MEQHRTRWRRLRYRRSLPVLTAGIAALVLGVTAADSSGPAVEARQRPRGFACTYVAPAPSEDYCDRLGKDRLQRVPTPDGSTTVDEDTVKRVQRAAVYGSWCPTPVDESCHTRPPEHAPTGTDERAHTMRKKGPGPAAGAPGIRDGTSSRTAWLI
ncbi:hypothetical protein GCM10009827_063470 [Dactylosporangium maewongense]|uniref:Secreted protein n=1 Tax=Dactylosporangium maewongense TaxID=634393 RepID=A0ABP4M2D3_9ACTN